MTRKATSSNTKAGDALPKLTIGPISRRDLALYAGASGDDNPAHIDLDFARSAGLDDVFAHGMLSMGYLGRVLTGWARPEQIRDYRVRFGAITPVHATVTVTGVVEEIFKQDGQDFARIGLKAEIDTGVATLTGSAIVALVAE